MATPVLQYLVAFNNNAVDDPNLITTVASPPGTLGAVNVWTDITRFVTHDSGNRGRQHELQQFTAGDRQIELRNDLPGSAGIFTTWNASGPYTGKLIPRKPFQVRATWSGTTYTRFTGLTDSWQMNWPDSAQQTVTLHVTDALRMFNTADITTSGYPAQVLADGATAYWRLGDPAGSATAFDSTGNNHPGVANGTVVFGQTGAIIVNAGTACSLATAGTATGWFAIPLGAAPTTQTYTLEAWVNVATWSAGSTDNMILQWFDAGTNSAVWWVNGSNQLVFQATDGTNLLSLNTTSTMPAGGWHYLAVTRSTTTVVMYLDGVSQPLHTVSALNAAAFTPTQMLMGSDFVGGLPGAEFPGSLQEVAVYPSALTGAQITNHNNLATFPQEGSGARIGRVLNAISWSAGARALDAGVSTVQTVTSSLTTTSSLNHMQQVEATEGGALFMTVDGKVRFYARSTLQSAAFATVTQATFGDNTGGGDIPFLPGPGPSRDDIDLYNEAIATRTGGMTQITDDTTSIAANGRVTWNPPAALIGISDTEVLELTQYIVSKFKTSHDRLAAITVDLASVANTFPSVIPTLLNVDLLYQVLVERTIMPGGGTAFSQTLDVEHISETVDAKTGTWLVTFGLAPPDVAFWILGTSQLGTNTTLAW